MLLDDGNPCILASTMFTLRTTVHSTTQYTPAQLIFGQDSIIIQCYDLDWEIIRKQKQYLNNKGNKHENCNQINHTYEQGDKVLLKNVWTTKFNQDSYLGPYEITVIRNNGTVRARKSGVTDTFNIQKLTPYKE